jgi:hypothetical protein
MKPSTITRAIVAHDLGADLHRWARRAAMIAAWLYVVGMAAGVAVHWLNDWLSGDRRAWPVRWGQWQPASRTGRLLKFEYEKSGPITEEQAVSFSRMVAPTFIIEKTGSGRWVDLQKMSVAELRGIARSLNIRRVRALDSGNLCGLHLARKADLIAALQ